MGEKGNQTKKLIKKAAYRLFARDGFKEVTMKDICEETGLSRGGLYRYYGSTAAIFEELFREMSDSSIDEFARKMADGVSAVTILHETLLALHDEILDSKNALSLAIYEYSNAVDSGLFAELNRVGIEKWKRFLTYGIERKEFKRVDIEQAVDVILYSYQGVRMWSRVTKLQENTADHIIKAVEEMLLGSAKEQN